MTRARFEIIPSDDVVERLRTAFPTPGDVTLTVTSLPKHGPRRTIDTAVALAGIGFAVVPHLAARSIEGPGELAGLLDRMRDAGIREAFVISGDAKNAAGGFATSRELIEEAVALDPALAIGVAGYPEGHPRMSDDALMEHLVERAPFIRSIVTQMCFSVEAIGGYAQRVRAAGIEAELWAGVPGPVDRARLVTLASRIGVGASLSFLKRSGGVATGLLRGRGFDPAPFVERLLADPRVVEGGLDGLHVYSFNEIERLDEVVAFRA